MFVVNPEQKFFICIYRYIIPCYTIYEEVIHIKTRIFQIRKDSGLTQTEFGSEIGASRAMIASYESGKVVPDKTTRLLLCEKFNVNEQWLETGEGLPYREGLIPGLVHALSIMPDVRAMLEEKLPKVSDDSWRKMNEALKAFLDDLN